MLEVRANYNRNVVCVFNRGPRVTYFLGLDGPQLGVCQMSNDEFERAYYHTPKRGEEPYTPFDFALAYTRDPSALSMLPISPSAIRVLKAIIQGQPPESEADVQQINLMESTLMASQKEDGFKKPDGPVAQVHKFLDGKIDGIKAGTVSRKECIDKLVEKGIANGTAVTQAGVWARNNGVNFARPTQAAEAKKEQAAAKRAPRKAKAAA